MKSPETRPEMFHQHAKTKAPIRGNVKKHDCARQPREQEPDSSTRTVSAGGARRWLRGRRRRNGQVRVAPGDDPRGAAENARHGAVEPRVNVHGRFALSEVASEVGVRAVQIGAAHNCAHNYVPTQGVKNQSWRVSKHLKSAGSRAMQNPGWESPLMIIEESLIDRCP